jgi:hypothetical protein
MRPAAVSRIHPIVVLVPRFARVRFGGVEPMPPGVGGLLPSRRSPTLEKAVVNPQPATQAKFVTLPIGHGSYGNFRS